MNLKGLAAKTPAWTLKGGQDDDVALWTRARLSRNLAGRPFPARAQADALKTTRELLLKKLSARAPLRGAAKIKFDNPSSFEKRLLSERLIIPADFMPEARFAALVVSPGEEICALANWQDALRLSFTGAGFCASELCDAAANFDDGLGDVLDYAWDDAFGWLSPSPENAGTGLEISALLHLPCLSRSGRGQGALAHMSNMRVGWRAGGSTEAPGDFCEIFTICSFGRSESEMLEDIVSAARFVITAERQARQWLFSDEKRTAFEDEAWRAVGVLQNARSISYEETRGKISAVLMGIAAGLSLPVGKTAALRVLALTKPAHIALHCETKKRHGSASEVSPARRDVKRAEIIRAAFAPPAAQPPAL